MAEAALRSADTLAADIAAKTAQCHTTEAALAEKTAQLQAKSTELEEASTPPPCVASSPPPPKG